MFDRCERQQAIVYVPAIVMWEVSLLARVARVNLRRTARGFFDDLFSNPSYQPFDMTTEQIFIGDELRFSRDPFDTNLCRRAGVESAPHHQGCRYSQGGSREGDLVGDGGLRNQGPGPRPPGWARHEASALRAFERSHQPIDHATDLLGVSNEYLRLGGCHELQPAAELQLCFELTAGRMSSPEVLNVVRCRVAAEAFRNVRRHGDG